MQIIQNIREKGAAIVIGVIALSLIGFILMDAKPGSSGGIFGGNPSSSLGKVNGEPIEYNEFNAKVKQAEEQYGGRVSGTQVYEIRQSVWDQIVAEKLLVKEFDKLGLSFSPKEMSSIMFSNDAPYALKQAFSDKTTGQYDIAKVQEWWQQAKKSKGEQRDAIESQIVEPMKLQALYNKYNSLIAASAYYPSWMQQKDNSDSKTFAAIAYVAIPYNVISDSTVVVSDEEIMNYMKKKKAIYKQDGGRYISYISFSANPTAADTLKSLDAVSILKTPFQADTNAKAFIARNMSSINYYDGFTLKSKLAMAQKDSIAALSTGNVFGPYLDGGNFVLAKMVGIRQMPDSVKTRHILVGTKDPQTGQPLLEDSIAKKRIDSIATAIKGGADFNAMVIQYSDDKGSKEKKGEYDFSSAQFGTLAKEFSETIFYGNTGDKKVVHTDFGWHYIEVMNQKNFEPAYKVAYLAKQILATDETVNSASSKATKLSGEARDAKSLDNYITRNGIQKVDVPDLIKQNDYRLGGLQDARQLIKWSMGAKQGEVSEPFNIEDQFVVAVINKIQPEGLPDVKTARPMVELTVRNLKKAEQIIKKLGPTPTLESAAAAYKVQIATAGADSTLTFSSQIINGVGNEPKVIGALFNKTFLAKVSEPIAGTNGVYVIKVNSIGNRPADTPEMVAQMTDQRKKGLLQQMSGWFESLKKTAIIKDERSKQF
ncbi:MAG: SurA N-terminal domain-containing protein [Ferruginibacter sp.]|nr:SurA N-terminal domain-containing protein [Ferruginibacter sp.]